MMISCLLIGSIICNILQLDYGSYAASPVVNSGFWMQGYQDPSKLRVPLSARFNAEPPSHEGQNAFEGNALQGDVLGKRPNWGPGVSGYDAEAEVDGQNLGLPGLNDVVPSQPDDQWHIPPSYDPRDEPKKPVVSRVSHLEPVYSFDTGSRYRRGKAMFVQSRYIPGEPRYPFWPIYWRFGKNWRRAAKTAGPGGF